MNYIDLKHDRFEDYETIISLYEGNAFTTWGMHKKDYFKHFHKNNPLSYTYYNFIKLYSEKLSEIVLGKNFTITTTTNDEVRDQMINEWMNRHDYIELQRQKLFYGCMLGDSITKMYTIGEEVHIDYITPDTWFPITNKFNINIVEGHALLHKYKRTNKQDVYLLEEHYPDFILYKALIKAGQEWEQIDIEEDFFELFIDVDYVEIGLTYKVTTNTSIPTVVRYCNQRAYKSIFGVSDFDTGSLSLLYNLCDVLSAIHATNAKTRNPIYALPNGTIKSILDKRKIGRAKNTNGKIKAPNPYFQGLVEDFSVDNGIDETLDLAYIQEYLTDILNKSQAVEKNSDGQSIDVVNHNPMMENSFKELDKLESFLYQAMSISPVLIDAEFRAGDLSGVALRNLANATIKKASRKAKELSRSIKQEITLLQELMGLAPLEVTVEISDGLATEPQDDYQWVLETYRANLMDRSDAISILRDLPAPEARKKAEALVDNIIQPIQTPEAPSQGMPSTPQE